MKRDIIPPPHAEFAALSKRQLHAMADGLLDPEPWIVEQCVQFVVAETAGLWHGRARAMMCRRLKHCDLGRTHRAQLAGCIANRLSEGSFSEQFKDQLRLAMHLDPRGTVNAARVAAQSPRAHVRRYAEWVLSHTVRPQPA